MSATESGTSVRRRGSPPHAYEVLNHLLRAANAIRSHLAEFLEPFDLNEGRHAALVALKESGEAGLSQSELAGVLAQSESNVSTLVDRMLQDGLVDRIRSETDRRKWVLRTSPTAQLLLDRVQFVRRDWAERMLHGLSEIDRATLGRLASRLDLSLNPRVPVGNRTINVQSPQEASRDDSLKETDDWPTGELSANLNKEIRTPYATLQEVLAALGLVNQLVEDEA